MDAYMTALRLALNQYSGRPWSLRKGRLTSHEKIYVTSPTDRKKPEFGTQMSREDRHMLAEIFKLDVGVISDMVVVNPEDRERALKLAQRKRGSA